MRASFAHHHLIVTRYDARNDTRNVIKGPWVTRPIAELAKAS
jgi:hypothetical protein